MSNFAPYDQYGNPRYKPGALLQSDCEYYTATNTANVPQAPISVDTVTGLTYAAGEQINLTYQDAYGFLTTYSYSIPTAGFNATTFGEFVIQNFAGQLMFYSSPALFGTGVILVTPTNTGTQYGLTTPIFTITNLTTPASVSFNLAFAVEKRIVPGRIVVRDYVSDDLSFVSFPGTASYQRRGLMHSVRPCDQIAAAASVLNFAGVSGNPSWHQNMNRLGVRSTGQYDSVIVYREAMILVEAIPGQFTTNNSNIGALFAETTPGNEGKLRATANATTVALPTSSFSFVTARGYNNAVAVSVRTGY